MKVDGACACGAIRIEAEADPEKTLVAFVAALGDPSRRPAKT
jgi:hypothetical protein